MKCTNCMPDCHKEAVAYFKYTGKEVLHDLFVASCETEDGDRDPAWVPISEEEYTVAIVHSL